MSEPVPALPPDYSPRFVIGHLSPGPAGEARVSIIALTGGVTWAEVAFFLCVKVISEFIKRSQTAEPFVPTKTQLESEQKAAALLDSSPAVRIYARGPLTVWLGQVALDAVGEGLREYGFIDVGPVPSDVRKACMRASDEAGFDKSYLSGPLPGAKPAAAPAPAAETPPAEPPSAAG